VPLVLRLAGAAHAVAEHRWLDRLIRGRMWIGIVGVGLIGIVFMQVSMLRLNAGIGRAVDQASTLERQNAALQASISQLSAGDRIEVAAGRLGLVAPAAGTARFLDARGVSARRAAARISAPGDHPPIVAPVTAVQAAPAGAVVPANPQATAAPPVIAAAPAPASPAAAPAQAASPSPAQTPAAPPAAAAAAVTGGAMPGQGG
jgi:hypothetical protein